MDLDLSVDFDRCAMELEAQLEALAERAPWLQDLIAREPTLYNQPRLRKGELSSVEVVVASNPGSVELAPGVALALVLGPEGRSCALVADEACVDEVDLVCMKDQLTHFVRSLSGTWMFFHGTSSPQSCSVAISAFSSSAAADARFMLRRTLKPRHIRWK